jgi:hypothetical protein
MARHDGALPLDAKANGRQFFKKPFTPDLATTWRGAVTKWGW